MNEDVLCTRCLYQLPQTHSHLEKGNSVERVFWGRFPVSSACARYYFRRETKVQHLLHQFKYKKAPEIGTYIGRIYGAELRKAPLFQSVDIIIPVPLHKTKLAKRGYNQAGVFAQGLSLGMRVPVDEHSLVRVYASESQTRKTRIRRWENVKTIFQITDTQALRGKHILLVDDVVTTGATIEACARKLLEIKDVKISVAAIAVAGKSI
jgi:ComF family protein